TCRSAACPTARAPSPVWPSAGFSLPSLPCLHGADEHIDRIERPQKKASSPVEEATLQHVHRQEPAQRSQDEVAQPGAHASSCPLLGRERRVPVGAREEIRHVAVAPMYQRRRETPHTSCPLARLLHAH